MPFVILIFALCTFALGFTEFVSIGLVANIADDLKITLSHAGWAVMAYALGAFIGAPLLTALAARRSHRQLLLLAMALFSVGNLIVSLAASLVPLLAGRFISGLGHGVFLAVAATAAMGLVSKEKSATAISFVFGGLTLALAMGVPIGTYIGEITGWRVIFTAIAIFGTLSCIALAIAMPKERVSASLDLRRCSGLKDILSPRVLAAASITVMAYAGAFSFYTYISPVLERITGLSDGGCSTILLIYGVMAAVGNIWGGKLTDQKGSDQAVMIVLVGLLAVLSGIWLLQSSAWAMAVLIGLLGALTYAAVPALQTRVMSIANAESFSFPEVASGLNIAGFNGGIALGSMMGGLSIQFLSLRSVAGLGAMTLIIAVLTMGFQLRFLSYNRVG